VRRRTAIPAVMVALALLAPACADKGADRGSAGANPTLATDPPTTTTTNPYAVPAVIDAAYANRVLAGLDAILGDVARTVLSTRTIPPDAYARLRAIYGTDSLLQLTIDGIQADIRRGFAGYKPQPGNRLSTVEQLISSAQKCIFVRVERSYHAVSTTPATTGPQWVALRSADPLRDPDRHNPTSWTMVYDGFPQDRSTPANPCVA
jgi:hypothetical protein